MAKSALASLMIKFGADNYEFVQKVKGIEDQMVILQKQMTKVGKQMSIAITAPLTAIAGVSLKNWDTQVKAQTKVQQAIEATGGAAKLTYEELAKFASELQGNSLFGDEKILNDITAKMLTFTNIAGDNFKKAQQAALDMATVLDQDVKGIVTQLGKALNDPVKNLSALSRMGIQFSKEQQETIKTFAETNRLAEAQSLILDSLASRYGGQAEAVAKAGLGPLIQLKNSWGDFLEDIGAAIAPTMLKIVDGLKKLVQGLQNLSPEVKKSIVVIGGIAASIGPVLLAVGGLLKLLPTLAAGFSALIGPVGAVIAIVSAAAGIIALASKETNTWNSAQRRLKETTKEFDRSTAAEAAQIDILFGKLKGATKGTDDYNTAKQQIINKYGSYLEGLSDEISTLEDVEGAYRAITAAAIQSAKARAAASATEKASEAYAKTLGNQLNLIRGKFLTELGDMTGEEMFGKLREQLNNAGGEFSEEVARAIDQFNRADPLGRFQEYNPVVDAIDKIKSARSILERETQEIESVWGGVYDVLTKPLDLELNQQLQQMLKETGNGTESVTGYINELKQKISDLEKQKGMLPAGAYEDVARLNGEIARLNKELENYQSITERIAIDPISIPAIALPRIDISIPKTGILQPIADRLWEEKSRLAEKMIAIQEEIEGIIGSFTQSIVSGFGEMFGNLIAGGNLNDSLKSIVDIIGNFVIQLGVITIMASKAVIAFKAAMSTLLGLPGGSLIAGLGLVAFGAAIKAIASQRAQNSAPRLASGGLAYGPTYAMVGDNRNAGVDPEVIAPLSKLKQYVQPAGMGGDVVFTIRGDVLEGILTKRNKQNSRF